MVASAGNVFNTLGKWSLTIDLVVLGVMFAGLLAFALWQPVDWALSRDGPAPLTFDTIARRLAGIGGSMVLVGLVAWLLLQNLRTQSAMGRRLRQLWGLGFLL